MMTLILMLVLATGSADAPAVCSMALPECPNYRPVPVWACASRECTCHVVCQWEPQPCAMLIAVCNPPPQTSSQFRWNLTN